MTWIARCKEKVKKHIAKLVRAEVEDMLPIVAQVVDSQNIREEERPSCYHFFKDPFGNKELYFGLKDRLLDLGVPVQDVDIDIADFEKWLDKFSDVKKYYQREEDLLIEKCLEHYMAFRYLELGPNDVYIDVASAKSNWAIILNDKKIKSFRLDMSYPGGIHGINIGADAGNTNLPEGFATALSTQCAFECFMGDADIRFIGEACRILSKGGRYAILPLYMNDTHIVSTSPYCDQKNIVIDRGAKRVWRSDGKKVPFARFYSPESFKERIYSNIPDGMAGKVIFFRNLPDVMKHYPGQRIYCFFMFYCEMKKVSDR